MKAKIPEKLFYATGGVETWKHYGITDADRDLSWKKYIEIDLEQFTAKRLQRLADMIEPYSKIRGAAMLLKDIRTTFRMATKEGKGAVKPRTVEQFSAMLRAYLADVQGHRIYERDELSEVWLPYYVEGVTYHPPTNYRSEPTPPFVSMTLFHEEFGKREKKSVSFYAEDCLHLTVIEAMASKGYYAETEEMRAEYLSDVEKWKGLVGKVGLQLRGVGRATDDLDGNPEKDSWSRYNKNTIVLDHKGEPAALVVDVFHESDKVAQGREDTIDLWFWERSTMKLATSSEEGDDNSNDDLEDEDDSDEATERRNSRRKDRRELEDEDVSERPEIEIPIHTKLACFDLRRHLRLRVHVGNVEVYQYDRGLAEKLVLPNDTTDLVEMLVAKRGVFRDIVAGKSGGSIILCAGPAGVGKTLTAEVYSESMERPLYSVQCSQLGTSPEKLESELFKIFGRAERWNAILLLDEADVYVMARGSDLKQNAIVGVFLRVLEYYAGVLFLTTNRSDKVDDAIASRCVARIDYELPTVDQQRRIWKVLSSTSGIAVADDVIEEVLRRHPALSGRDIKNLIKLAGMVSETKGTAITADTIDFVKKFKPTADQVRAKLVKGSLLTEGTAS